MLHKKAYHFLQAFFYWVLNRRKFVTDEQAIARRAHCKPCAWRVKGVVGDTCMGCGCHINLASGVWRSVSKLYYPDERCPRDFWPAIDPPEDS